MKIANFGQGSIKIIKGTALVQLAENRTGDVEEADIERLISTHNQEPDTLYLNHAAIDNGRVHLTYDIPDEFINLEHLKQETLPIRIAAIKQVLDIDPLDRKYPISLHPSTIFFRPMTRICFTYVDILNVGQKDEHSKLEHYKALAYALISCQSYDAFLRYGAQSYKSQRTFGSKQRETEAITKLMKTIEETETLSELKTDLQQSYEYTQYQYFQDIVSIEKRSKNKFYAVIVSAFLVFLLGVSGVYFITDAQNQAIAQAYDQKLKQKELKIDQIHAVHDQDFKKVINIMKQRGKSKEAITDFLINKEQYQLALAHNPTTHTVKQLASVLYEQEQQKKLLDLELEGNERLSDEKAVVAYNTTVLDSRKSFITDPTLAHRMGEAFIQHDDLNSAEYLANKFDDKKLINRIKDKKQQKAMEKQINALKQKIDDLRKQKEKAKDDKKKKTVNQELKKAKKRLKALKE